MALYREKLQQVDAMQWDGTQVSAEAIVDHFTTNYIDITGEVIVQTAPDAAGVIVDVVTLTLKQVGYTNVRPAPYDWVVVNEIGVLTRLSPTEFARLYEPVV